MERSALFFFSTVRFRHAGFTLIEALITVALVALIGIIAISSGRIFLLSNRMTIQINTLVADLAFARSEAIKRGTIVTVCQSTSGANCTGQDTWHEGWIVFADPNESHKVETGETILRATRPPATGSIRYMGSVDHFIRYESTGLGWPAGQFIICDARGRDSAKFLIINILGRPRVSKTPADSDPVTCP